jgi:hypothetical protein
MFIAGLFWRPDGTPIFCKSHNIVDGWRVDSIPLRGSDAGAASFWSRGRDSRDQ